MPATDLTHTVDGPYSDLHWTRVSTSARYRRLQAQFRDYEVALLIVTERYREAQMTQKDVLWWVSYLVEVRGVSIGGN